MKFNCRILLVPAVAACGLMGCVSRQQQTTANVALPSQPKTGAAANVLLKPVRPVDPQPTPSVLANARQTLSAPASWRPAPIGQIAARADTIREIGAALGRVSFAAFNARGGRIYGWLDLANGDVTSFETTVPRRTGFAGDYRWVYRMNDQFHTLELTEKNGVTRNYEVRGLYYPQQKDELPVRVLSDENRVRMFADDRLFEWNLATGRLLKNGARRGDTLARDGKTFVGIGENYGNFQIGDVATGKILKTIPWRTDGPLEYEYFSRYGRYCLFDTRDQTFRVVEVATGKVLWKFPVDFIFVSTALMSDDEKTIVVREDKAWQVRDFRTGAIVRRLAYVPDLNAAALAPDGATLYSVANGTLFRQRAR